MKHLRKCTALLLAVLMVLALAACGQKDDTAAVDKDLTVNVVSLNGTTGFGMAKLHMHPFIVTLGTQLISYCLLYTSPSPRDS